jgi:putative membrane protein
VTSGKVKAEMPTVLDSSHQGKLDKLKKESGRDFSSQFDSDQVSAHKDAVSLFERYARGADNADLKDWAGKTLPTLKHHLETAEDLKKKTGGSS